MTGAVDPHELRAHSAGWVGVGVTLGAVSLVALSWWAWGRFAAATGAPVEGLASRWVIGVALCVCTLLTIRAQHRFVGGDAGVVPPLVVGVILGGLVAAFGVTLADALMAVAVAAVMVVSLSASRRAQALVAGVGIVCVGALAAWLARESWLGATHPWLIELSYGNQWRHAADIWDVIIVAWLLGGVGMVAEDDCTPLWKIVCVTVVIETAVIIAWPVSLGHFAATMLVPALVLSGRGWKQLRAQAYSNPTPVLRGLLLILTVGLIPWIWTPLRAVGRVLTVAMFGG